MNPRLGRLALALAVFATPAVAGAQAHTWTMTTGSPVPHESPAAQAPRASGQAVSQSEPAHVVQGQATTGIAQSPVLRGAPMAPPRARTGQLVNVKVEFTITDQVGTKPPVKKTMTMVVADGESSRIRTNVEFNYTMMSTRNDKGESSKSTMRGIAPLSVDVSPVIEGGKVRLDFSIEYSATDVDGDGAIGAKTNVSERLAAVLESGVPLVVAQSSDAYSDRKVTVEIKASILK